MDSILSLIELVAVTCMCSNGCVAGFSEAEATATATVLWMLTKSSRELWILACCSFDFVKMKPS